MKKYKLVAAFAFIFTTAAAAANIAYAVSPPFARTDEEWQKLRDNKLEYGEIAGLIKEYNPTVQDNQIKFFRFKKDYGIKNSEVSDAYKKMAEDILKDIDEGDPDSPSYASQRATAQQSKVQADNLLKSADDTLEDAEIYRLNYENTEMQLVQLAQNNFLSYFSKQLTVEKAKADKEFAKSKLETVKAKLAAGAATQVEVLDAQEALIKGEQAETDAQSAVNTVKQKLIISCGWAYNAEPEFGEIPELDLSRIDAMNPTADLEKALANNYTLKVNERKLANASSQTQKDTQNNAISSNKLNIASSVTEAYQNVITARDAYTYANTNSQLQKSNLETAKKRYSLGAISLIDLKKQENDTINAEIAYKQSVYALQTAISAYEWTINGLAKATS